MELSVLDRVLLLNVLPKEGDLTTLRIVRKLREDLSFSEAEHAELKFTQDEKGVHWETALSKDIDIGAKAKDVIVGALKKVDEEKRLTEEFLPLCDVFLGGEA